AFPRARQDGGPVVSGGEPLWHVVTPEARRRGKPGRVLETREMIGRLRQAHQHRYELPLLTAPAEFEAQDVPIDPYALGLLLGDGWLTTKTTPSELQRRGTYDYVLRHEHGHRGGVIVANPVTAALRELGLAGTCSHTKFIPGRYQDNTSAVRVALLQGLLDSDGGPVVQQGRTCRIQYTTCSEALRDDVVYLVQSLGGVAYWRRREADGRSLGLARGRPVEHRHDAFVMDLRLPSSIQPFRLRRKREIYD